MYVLSPTSTKPKYRLIKMEKKKKITRNDKKKNKQTNKKNLKLFSIRAKQLSEPEVL